jgi:hypothetical protein
MRKLVVLSTFIVVGGCVSAPPVETVIDQAKFQDAFGNVPIIQRGMELKVVDRLVGSPSKVEMQSANQGPVTTWLHSCGLIIEESDSGKVMATWCSTDMVLPGPLPKDFIPDSMLNAALVPGLAPKEVEEKIGQPACGFSNNPGKVHLWYPKHGIEVVFDKDKLERWRRVITYRDARVQ